MKSEDTIEFIINEVQRKNLDPLVIKVMLNRVHKKGHEKIKKKGKRREPLPKIETTKK